ncbi:AraC-type DNA-binding protein [Solimonas aquatica]|uniref:AraC-type DNA-binding protein n=1 Tax=Solimonas aquatica TaxID=489703 RepID=A0A1H9CNI1_9GAMM|nr:AraC family transcriptional regulator [Solimonas aquatica]SEQ02765.1 AraC-type DNA-binding protein [Solimonas aquatica]
MHGAPTLALHYLGALFDYLRARGLAPQHMLEAPLPLAGDREARIAEAQAARWFEQAAQALHDDALGLHVGEQIRPDHYGVLGYTAMACATLGEALACQQRYQALVLNIVSEPAQIEDGRLILRWLSEGGVRYRQLAEFNLGAMLSFIRWLSGQKLQPLRLDFQYPQPPDIREHQRVFGCELRFAQPRYALLLPLSALSLPLIQPDPAMRALMDHRAAQQLAALRESDDDALSAARRLIAQSLGGHRQPLELSGLAAQLKLSSRSLQRKLAQAGLSYSQLLDGVRAELAQRYLQDESLSLTDIAFLLGYSEQSAFTRAHRRWTGRAPQAARQTRAIHG